MRLMSDRGFTAWFVVCALLGVVWTGVLIWLVIAAIQWLGRH
jgi:hypothetical protein